MQYEWYYYRGQVTYDAALVLGFFEIHINGADPDDVIRMAFQLIDKPLSGRKVKKHAWLVYVFLDEFKPPGAMKHPQGKRALPAYNLIMKELHGVT